MMRLLNDLGFFSKRWTLNKSTLVLGTTLLLFGCTETSSGDGGSGSELTLVASKIHYTAEAQLDEDTPQVVNFIFFSGALTPSVGRLSAKVSEEETVFATDNGGGGYVFQYTMHLGDLVSLILDEIPGISGRFAANLTVGTEFSETAPTEGNGRMLGEGLEAGTLVADFGLVDGLVSPFVAFHTATGEMYRYNAADSAASTQVFIKSENGDGKVCVFNIDGVNTSLSYCETLP